MFAILSPLLGGMTVAIDSTAGERERGSLEPLLANPVPAREFVARQVARRLDASPAAVAVLTLTGLRRSRRSLYAQKKLAALLAVRRARSSRSSSRSSCPSPR